MHSLFRAFIAKGDFVPQRADSPQLVSQFISPLAYFL